MMALIGCQRSGRTRPTKIHQKVPLPTQEIALSLYSSTRRRWHVKNKRKNFEDSAP